jgi:hypothetical protein
LNNVVALCAGSSHSLALESDGTVVLWGNNYFGQSTVPAGLQRLDGIASGSLFNLGLFSPPALPAQLTFSNLSQVYDGSARTVSVATMPPGLPVNVTYNGSPDAPTNVGRYTVMGAINDPNYQGGATNTLIVMRRLTAGDLTYPRAPGLGLRIQIANLLTNVSSLPDDKPALMLVGVGVGGQNATIVTNKDYLLYLPVNDNPDTFTYVVGDDSGGSAMGSITVNVCRAVGPDVSVKAITLNGNTATINAFGIPGMTYALQTTTNVGGGWWPIGTNTASGDGSLIFVDPNATNVQQYYRMAQP